MSREQKEIHSKGFNLFENRRPITEYNKMKIGTKVLEDIVLNLGTINKVNRMMGSKNYILKALAEKNLEALREISNYYYRTDGVYNNVCNTYATFYRYDWVISPEILDEKVDEEVIIKEFTRELNFLDNSCIQQACTTFAHEIIVNGAYYGCLMDVDDRIVIQQLPIDYCRSRFNAYGNVPIVEFNMSFFDEKFKNDAYRMKVLDMFPKDFKKGYILYKQHKLPPEDSFSDHGIWYTLEPGRAFKFNFNGDDIPMFVSAIPSLIDLNAAQDLDRRRQMQQLQKVFIQKLPLDKNGDLIFDVDEAADIHGNAVDMLKNSLGVEVFTTFAETEVADLADTTTTSSTDDLEKVERTVFNNFGTAQNLFNPDGNLSLEKAILNSAGAIRHIKLQFENFYNNIVKVLSPKKKKFFFKFCMVETTQYNYTDLAKLYKEQTQIGFSKMLPQIALGHSQSFIINTAHFENEVLHLSDLMLPPLQSSTMNAEGLKALSDTNEGNGKTGRPKKDNDEKSDKTIQNEESMS